MLQGQIFLASRGVGNGLYRGALYLDMFSLPKGVVAAMPLRACAHSAGAVLPCSPRWRMYGEATTAPEVSV